MASFLLGDYYSDSSADSSDEQQTASAAPAAAVGSAAVGSAAPVTALPSADELFASDTSSVLATSGVPRSSSVATNPTTSYSTKRKGNAGAGAPGAGAKRAKTESGAVVAKADSAKPRSSLPFAPPQLRRPNISTEDRGSWTTDKTIAMQRKARQLQSDAGPMTN